MTTENLKKAISLSNELEKAKLKAEQMTFAINCMRNDNCNSAFINIRINNIDGHSINNFKEIFSFEVGNLIDLFTDELANLNERIDQMDFKFTSL